MKKIMIAMLLCMCGLPGFAQNCYPEFISNNSYDRYQERHAKQLQKQQAALDKAIEEAVFPKIELGKFKFEIAYAQPTDLGNGKTLWSYSYTPKNGPAVFREKVVTNVQTNVSEIVGWTGWVTPLKWEYADYEVSSIEIDIYPDNRLEQLAEEWADALGRQCIVKLPIAAHLETRVVNMMHTPTRAVLMNDGRTMVVSVLATSEKFGPYRAKCESNVWQGRIFTPFSWMTSRILATSLPEIEYTK